MEPGADGSAPATEYLNLKRYARHGTQMCHPGPVSAVSQEQSSAGMVVRVLNYQR